MKTRKITKLIAIIAAVAMLASFLAINVSADETNIAASGYAAIGVVDGNKAEVLLGTGEQGTVIFTGDAPVTGGVYRYTRDENNAYTFVEPVANHGNSSLTDASKAYWWMWMSEDYGYYMWDAAPNHYWPTDTNPIFLRTSLTEWMVTTKYCFTTGTQVAGYQLDAVSQNGSTYYDVGAIVLGGLEADGTINTTGFDALKLPETKYDLSAFTTALHPGAEPETPKEYTASGSVVATGYAAIGVVDEELSKVQVLLDNGKVGAVYYAGAAPKTGAVYGYELYSNNVFVFVEKTGNLGNSDQLAAGQAWDTYFEAGGWAWSPAADIWHMADPETHTTDVKPIFLRFGDNKWALITIDKDIDAGNTFAIPGYSLDTVALGDIGNGLQNYTTGALVLGGMNADGTINTTNFDKVFGLTAGDIDLGSFGADLYTPSAKTGDASPIVAIIVAAVFSIGAIGFMVSKKKEF